MEGAEGTGGAPTNLGPCSFSVSVLTVETGGKYAPDNIGAIWIADGGGTFVKSLAVWAKKRISHLTAWTDATTQAGLDGNTVDAVTSATLSSHRTHQVSWNCTDTNEKVVPDGPYSVHFEVTDKNSSGPTASVPFTKGTKPITLSPPDEPNFKEIQLVFMP
jgi:hypothetical protein